MAVDLMALIERLYPITRSITGDGVRQTLSIMGEHIDIAVHEVPSGTQILDWTVPPEWNIHEAWIKGPDGGVVVDLADSNLHVVGYSTPIHTRLALPELQPHLHSLPDRPHLVPFVNSYYTEAWGFCLRHDRRLALQDGAYEVLIDSTLEPGSLTYGEHVIPGRADDELLISAHVCHPSLANENLSGLAASVELAGRLAAADLRHTVRFVFAPATVGAITWLARNEARVARIVAGLTLTSLADGAPLTYKKTVDGDLTVDVAAQSVLEESGAHHRIIDFYPFGYDERQYNSPGFRAPVGSFMRAIHGQTPEYHTSGDDLGLIDVGRLDEAIDVIEAVIRRVDEARVLRNRAPHGEPQLGRRGIYDAVGGSTIPDFQLAMLWVLNLSDGRRDMRAIARRSSLPLETIEAAADLLVEHDLLS